MGEKVIEKSLNFGQVLGAINCMFDGARGAMYNLSREQVIETSLSFSNEKINSINELNILKKSDS